MAIYTSDVNRFTGLSGIDTESMVDQMMKAESAKYNRLEKEKTKVTWKQEAFRQLITSMQNFQNKWFSTTSLSSNIGYDAFWNNYKTSIIDKNTGNIIELKDLFKDDSYIDVLSQNIKEQMKEQMANDENKIYFVDADIPEGNFEKIKEDQNFYFNNENNLVICFDEYEVAPGYMGPVEFVIPKDVTNDILK